jgi:23S rRNA (cytosine1962-C5)-methyltransferase
MTALHNIGTSVPISRETLIARVTAALEIRREFIEGRHETAFRLFNGFYEGYPDLAIEVYAKTLLLFNYANPPGAISNDLSVLFEFLRSRLPWLRTIVYKARFSEKVEERRGTVLNDDKPDRRIYENGVWYAIDLLLNQDTSLYLDTRNLRAWVKQNLVHKTLLDTFAYTGSYGVAARAGGARRVVFLDLNRKFLNIAKTSYTFNGFPIQRQNFLNGDFWTSISLLKHRGERFDCVIVDPPIYSRTKKGTIDLIHHGQRVINKVRPLINDNGFLIAVNNALFVSGLEYIHMLESLCADGYLTIEELIPVPMDFTGSSQTLVNLPPADPAPFNHPTKIVILRVRRKTD